MHIKNTFNTLQEKNCDLDIKGTNIHNLKYIYICMKAKIIYIKVTPCILVLSAKKTSPKKVRQCIPLFS